MSKSSLTYEWQINGVAALYEATKAPGVPTQPLCSRAFGGGKWRLFLHGNNGRPGFDGYIGPTAEEKRSDVMGKWSRAGKYSFTIELQTIDGEQTLITVSTREDVTFTNEKRQWGYPDFGLREEVFENCLGVTMHDAFVLSCTIHTMPTTPQTSLAPSPTMTTITLPETNPQGYSSLPSTLVDVLRSMVDDPSISDVQFVFPRSKESRYSTGGMKNGKNSKYHHAGGVEDDIQSEEGGLANSEYGSMPNVRIISARKDILALRSEYFSKLFASNLANGGTLPSSPANRNYHANPYYRYGAEEDDMYNETDGDAGPGVDPDIPGTNLNTIPSENQSPLYESPHHPRKTVILVNDIPYSTYRALIYFLYTDNIVFAPLASQFMAQQLEGKNGGVMNGPATRLEWLRIWKKENRGYALPCSAKSMYAVASRFKLASLKRIAYEFIRKNLNPSNLAFEYFDSFTAAHDDLRNLALQGMVTHWEEVQRSPAMIEVWNRLTTGDMPFAKDLLPLLVRELSRPRN
ncbi:SubName: Full=Uncharacterized protein {ECO:0000313/EMBL:CCA72058.1} [Serendipita indica DSM 11827]|uniref:BTB domain-containing protein n=1 Tax=Serendipita indica (strain DSM 11827) TaxID=1109443 RepID=G4TL65_SERID|nr:SubName: Full=Uncharacterized protein {ECO:0000313/EMBL:CCA72058.1} [Serendipita indica DSM 11827]CCA72058.1 hypothetical protein PIIN_05994 [Serendipita indica DSM 11827]